ncbi:MAG: radical SAM protein [Candidatus Omnitrophota bacterium]
MITDACNLKCRHCDIWRLPAQMADDKIVKKLLDDPVVEKSYNQYGKEFDISIGGGEPFLHPGLQEIVAQIDQKYPGSLKSISTNGVLTKNIFRLLKNNPALKFKLNISVDGLGETHDRIRGVNGTFDQTVKTIRMIKHAFPDQRVEMKMAIMRDNFSEIQDVYNISQKLGCSFSCKPVDQMEYYTNRNSVLSTSFEENEIHSIRNQLFSVADEMRHNYEYKKARFTKDIPFHLAGKRRHASCSVLRDHITVMVNGDVFFCIKERKAGNIIRQALSEMETKPKDFECKSCMLMCGSFKDYDEAPYTEVVANVEATLECNLSCDMCTQKELKKEARSLSYGNFCNLVRDYGIDHVSFVGGESFLNTEIFRMMGLLDSRGISYEITTNGTLFSDENKEKLKKCIGLKKINFSLDGLEEYHDRERGKGVFKEAMKSLIFSRQFFTVAVVSIIKSDNLLSLIELCKYLKTHGVIPQKFIYAMNISDADKQGSLGKIPDLKIQGPECRDQVKKLSDLQRFFVELEGISSKNFFEPEIMRTDTNKFLSNELTGACRQLDQMRLDPDGNRIICEFIRNKHAEKIANDIDRLKLPICHKCCKLGS